MKNNKMFKEIAENMEMGNITVVKHLIHKLTKVSLLDFISYSVGYGCYPTYETAIQEIQKYLLM